MEELHVGVVHVSELLDHCAVKQLAPRHMISILYLASVPLGSEETSCFCFSLNPSAHSLGGHHLDPLRWVTWSYVARKGPAFAPTGAATKNGPLRALSFSSPPTPRSVRGVRSGCVPFLRSSLPLLVHPFPSIPSRPRSSLPSPGRMQQSVVQSTPARESTPRPSRRKRKSNRSLNRSTRGT